jgi:hypothetical protein
VGALENRSLEIALRDLHGTEITGPAKVTWALGSLRLFSKATASGTRSLGQQARLGPR